MKFVDEYRDYFNTQDYAEAIARLVTRPWTIMEVCGGQTHTIVKYGLEKLLPAGISVVHGPGCPVCVTPMALIDTAIDLALTPGVTFCSFGDMLRVPGSSRDLQTAKAQGGDVRVVYSPLDALEIAKNHPTREVVFFAVGFETTAPATAMAAVLARRQRVANFSLLSAHVLLPPALKALLGSPHNCVQGVLLAGHVCTVMGYHQYEPLAQENNIPLVVTGFEPLDILQGIHMCLRQLETGEARVENQYSRAVRPEGNVAAQQVIGEVFQPVDRNWRGLGLIPASGYGLTEKFADFDAQRRFRTICNETEEATECLAGLILQGIKKPDQCPAFRLRCTPEQPLGAPMVSSEGACAAYYRYCDIKQ
jgi:hydrogenase expression/formation protein HypD